MIVVLRQRFWMLRVLLLLAVLVGVSACQVTSGQTSAAVQLDPEAKAYKQFGQMIAFVRTDYFKPMSTERLLTLALNRIEGTGTELLPDAHEIVQNTIRAVTTASDEQAQLAAFTEGIGLLSGGQPADTPRLVRAAMIGMVKGLDSYSLYIPANTVGAPASVGLTLKRVGPEIVVLETDSDAPAALAGIQPGDVMVQVDGQSIEASDLDGVWASLRGSIGSPVQLVLRRAGRAAPLSVRLIRQVVPPPELAFSMRDSVALIRPKIFSNLTLSALDKALVNGVAQAGGHLSGIVIDLRDNEGGLFDVAIRFADRLLQPGDPIVSLQGQGPSNNRAFRALKGSFPADVPMVVLVNGRTASGAEMAAAALGDSRALLLGSRTFGMGMTQVVSSTQRIAGDIFPGYIRLTTAQMFGPNGQSWQRRGLTPDIPAQSAPSLDKAREDILPGALPTPPDITAPTRPNPLRARLPQITPSLLPTPTPANPTTDFAVEQALRAISLLQPSPATP